MVTKYGFLFNYKSKVVAKGVTNHPLYLSPYGNPEFTGAYAPSVPKLLMSLTTALSTLKIKLAIQEILKEFSFTLNAPKNRKGKKL